MRLFFYIRSSGARLQLNARKNSRRKLKRLRSQFIVDKKTPTKRKKYMYSVLPKLTRSESENLVHIMEIDNRENIPQNRILSGEYITDANIHLKDSYPEKTAAQKEIAAIARNVKQALKSRRHKEGQVSGINAWHDSLITKETAKSRTPIHEHKCDSMNRTKKTMDHVTFIGEVQTSRDKAELEELNRRRRRAYLKEGDIRNDEGVIVKLHHSPREDKAFFEKESVLEKHQMVLFVDNNRIMTGEDIQEENSVAEEKTATDLRRLLVMIRKTPENNPIFKEQKELMEALDLCFKGKDLGMQVLGEILLNEQISWSHDAFLAVRDFSESLERNYFDTQCSLLLILDEAESRYQNVDSEKE